MRCVWFACSSACVVSVWRSSPGTGRSAAKETKKHRSKFSPALLKWWCPEELKGGPRGKSQALHPLDHWGS